MSRRLYILLFCSVTSVLAMSQTDIQGSVKLQNGQDIDFASIIVSPVTSPKTILGSTFTAENGSFRLNVSSDCDSLMKASSVEISPVAITIPNRSGIYDIIVEERVIGLREVVVKAKKIYAQGDTLNYNVASFLSQSDLSVADVLRKMPGITVSESGQVSYQGILSRQTYKELLH